VSNKITNNDYKIFLSLKQKKFRDEYGLFLVEGEHLASEIIKSKKYFDIIECVLIRTDFENDFLISKFKQKSIFNLERKLFDKLSDTKNPQGIILIVKTIEDEIINSSEIIVGLDSINDPGNLGTVLRTCYWFNIKNVVIGKNSCDLFNTKTVRSTQGAMFHLNIIRDINMIDYISSLIDSDYEIIVTDLNGNNLNDYKINKNKKYFIIFGNEANGISNEILSLKDIKKIKINSYSDCESLNVSVSAGIVLNEFAK